MSSTSIPPQHDLGLLSIDERSRRSGKAGKLLVLLAVAMGVMVIIAGLMFALKGRKLLVEVAAARPTGEAQAETLLNASGYVTPRRRATVAAKVTGRIEEIYAEEGLHVKAGQVLATLDCSQPSAALASAKTDRDATAAALGDLQVQLANAERELNRAQSLKAAGVISQESLDKARTTVDSFQSKITLAREQIRASESKISVAQQDVDNCTVRAPFAGVVVSRDAQRGEIVSPISAGGGFTRTGIATLVDMNSLEIEVDVNETYIARVKPGQKVIATLDPYPDWRIPAKVRTVIPTADRQKATVKVRLAFDDLDPRMLPDMGVKVAFLGDEPPAAKNKLSDAKILIPRSAVRTDDGKTVVFLAREGKLERRAVKLGAEHGTDVEVMAGLSAGDAIVVKGVEALQEGQAVEIKQ